jgi:hypothetical protein
VVAPTIKKLKAIAFQTVPRLHQEGCRPFLEIYNNIDDTLLYTNKDDKMIPLYSADYNPAILFEFAHGKEAIIFGDIQFVFKSKGVIGDSQICRIAMNTAFIPPSNVMIFKKNTVSPDSVRKDSRFSDNFLVEFVFEDYCTKCNKSWMQPLESYCDQCK